MNQINYILVEWPETQDLMEQPWFINEAILNYEMGSAFFIPENRIINNSYILKRCEELAVQLNSTEKEENYIDEQWNDAIPFEGGMNTFESILNLKLSL
jgi:hypothetical protein